MTLPNGRWLDAVFSSSVELMTNLFFSVSRTLKLDRETDINVAWKQFEKVIKG